MQARLIFILVLRFFKILAIVFAVAAFAYIAVMYDKDNRIVNVSRFVSNCPLHIESCLMLISDVERLEISLSPPNLPPFENLELRIDSKRIAVSDLLNLRAWLEGRDMDMAQHYFQFVEQVVTTDKTILVGFGMIPICSIDSNMVWELVVEYDFQGSHRQLTFELDRAASAS